MAYLTKKWTPKSDDERHWNERWKNGQWVPELDRKRWRARNRHCRLRKLWVSVHRPTPADLTALSLLPLEERLRHLWALGKDIGSVERDGLLYANLLENLKNAIGTAETDNDAAADQVVDRMKAWGLSSADMSRKAGGPPKPASPRPWRKVMDWLLSRLRDVGEMLLKLVEVFWALFKDLAGATSISVTVNVGLTPTLGISFEPDQTTATEWLKRFLSTIWGELGSGVFNRRPT